MTAIDPISDYARIERAIRFIAERRRDQPDLDAVAAHVGLSRYHFQRLFVRWAGVSPKQFLGFLTVEHAKALLREGESVLGAALETGLSGPGRLHDLFVSCEAMTPGDYKREGAGLVVRWGVHDTPVGPALVLVTDRGVCGLSFLNRRGVGPVLDEARAEWPLSRFAESPEETSSAAAAAFVPLGEDVPRPKVLLKGTRFQIQVWRALLALPAGAAGSYTDVAAAVGRPAAARAVGQAVAANRIAVLVPCHRVLRADGVLSGYRWEWVRKQALLAWESARTAAAEGDPPDDG